MKAARLLLRNPVIGNTITTAERTFKRKFFRRLPERAVISNAHDTSLWNIPTSKRTYFTELHNNTNDKQMVLSEIRELYDNILITNWNDSFSLVLNVPLWEGIASAIEEKMKLVETDDEVLKAKTELNNLLDILFILEDLRDHINELLEQSSRATGLAGTGILSSFQINNIDEHIDFLKNRYEQLLETYPNFKYQINLVLGKGLALLRQKYAFEWKHMHEFFF